jgi:hypothetical protein
MFDEGDEDGIVCDCGYLQLCYNLLYWRRLQLNNIFVWDKDQNIISQLEENIVCGIDCIIKHIYIYIYIYIMCMSTLISYKIFSMKCKCWLGLALSDIIE